MRDKKTVIKTERKREADGLRDIHDREREREGGGRDLIFLFYSRLIILC